MVIAEICTVLPEAPPNDEKVCCVTVVCSVPESTNVVGKGLPFHRIWDCGVKFVPVTVSRAD
jgi:hypothetical protein